MSSFSSTSPSTPAGGGGVGPLSIPLFNPPLIPTLPPVVVHLTNGCWCFKWWWVPFREFLSICDSPPLEVQPPIRKSCPAAAGASTVTLVVVAVWLPLLLFADKAANGAWPDKCVSLVDSVFLLIAPTECIRWSDVFVVTVVIIVELDGVPFRHEWCMGMR